jgi:hypothetical protein
MSTTMSPNASRSRHVRPRPARPARFACAAVMAVLASAAAPVSLHAQDEPRLLRAEPGGFVVTPGSSDVGLDLYGENLWDADRLWTERNVRVYARHASGDEPWQRLFTGTGDIGEGAPEDASEALPHGRAIDTAPDRYRFLLPASVWLDRKGTIEFKVVRGLWRRAGDARWRFQESAVSNILRLPVAEAPRRPPEVREVSPALLPARHDGAPPTLWVRASDLTLDPEVRIGDVACPRVRVDVSLDFIECLVPEAVLDRPDTYEVTVRTSAGTADHGLTMSVVAPPAIDAVTPEALPAKGPDALVVVRFSGSEPDSARMRRTDRGGWMTVTLRPIEPGAARLELPAALRGYAGEIEMELGNLAGSARASVALCADEGPNPLACSRNAAAASTEVAQGLAAVPTAGRSGR